MVLKIGVIPWPPGAMPCFLDETCSRRGYGIDTTELVCKSLNLSCTFVPYDGTEFGDYNDTTGEVTGILGAIAGGQFDTSLPVFTPTFRRAQALGFSDVYFYTGLVMATRSPNEIDERDLNLLYAFQWPIWCTTILTFLLVCVLITAALGKRSWSEPRFSAFSNTALSMITSDYGRQFTTSSILRILVLTWLGTAFVLMASCTAFLLSFKLARTSTLPYKDLETFIDCLYEGRCRLLTSSSSSSFIQLLQDTESLAPRFSKALQRYPAETALDTEIHDKLLQNHEVHLVWPGPSVSFYYQAQMYPECSFYTVEAPYKVFGSFPLRKNDTVTARVLNSMAGYFQESGLSNMVQKKYQNVDSRSCTSNAGMKHEEYSPIRLVGLVSVCKFYVIGMAIGAAVFGLEVLMSWRMCSRCPGIRSGAGMPGSLLRKV